jgi:hypothetical protein
MLNRRVYVILIYIDLNNKYSNQKLGVSIRSAHSFITTIQRYFQPFLRHYVAY